MSDPREEGAGTGSQAPNARRTGARFLTLPRMQGRKGWGLGLAGALLLLVALASTGPLWAPLLPWGAPAPAQTSAAPLQSEARTIPAEAAASAALRELDRRVAALEAKPAAPVGDIAEIRQQVASLSKSAGDLATRIGAVENTLRTHSAGDPTDIALVLALLQIRDAVEVGRPFAAAYDVLAALAAARPEIAAAGAPLAEPAKTGLAGRAVLAGRLRELASAIATAPAPASTPANTTAAAPTWTDQALARVRGLVTIRRISEPAPGKSGATLAAVNAAEQALAGGDLAAATGALGVLTGAPAEAAGPWLRMAKERLAAEAALQKIEALLVARLGAPGNAPASAGLPR